MDLLKAMATFRKVVEQSSFSGAAKELNVVTSAVSRQVADLEKHLGCKLLQRSSRSMTLTEEGREYLDGINKILDHVSRLEQNMSERQNIVAGELRITSFLNSQALGLQARMSQFLKLYPQVKLSWLIVNRNVNLIEEGIDVAIRAGKLPDSGLVAREIGMIQLHYVASPDYLNRHGAVQTPADLASHQCIIDTSNQNYGRWTFKGKEGLSHVKVSSAIEVSNGEAASAFAADGLGVAWLPDFLVASYIDDGKLVRVLPDYDTAPVPVSLVYPANRVMKPAQRAFIDFLTEHKLEDLSL